MTPSYLVHSNTCLLLLGKKYKFLPLEFKTVLQHVNQLINKHLLRAHYMARPCTKCWRFLKKRQKAVPAL